MRQLNGVYTQAFNRRHKRVGHIFQGRYKAILIQKESHLLEVSRLCGVKSCEGEGGNPSGAMAMEQLPCNCGKGESPCLPDNGMDTGAIRKKERTCGETIQGICSSRSG